MRLAYGTLTAKTVAQRAATNAWKQKNVLHIREYNLSYREQMDARVDLLNGARARAKKAGLEFSITVDDVTIPEQCPVLGIPLIKGKGVQHDGSPSLDRFDLSLGYTPDNVQVISHMANKMKSNATPEQLHAFARWIQKEI